MGKFQEGNSGRPKGSKNKKTQKDKERIQKVLRELDKTIIKDLRNLSSKSRVTLWLSLQAYVLAKPKPIEDKEEEEHKDIEIVFINADGSRGNWADRKKVEHD